MLDPLDPEGDQEECIACHAHVLAWIDFVLIAYQEGSVTTSSCGDGHTA